MSCSDNSLSVALICCSFIMNLKKRISASVTTQVTIILTIFCFGTLDANKIKDVTDKAFQQEALQAINQVRVLHNAPPLRMNAKLSFHAFEWCEALLQKAEKARLLKRLFANGKFEGENVFVKNVKTEEEITATMAVNDWYCEDNVHNFSNNFIRGDTAQFTQLIWKSVTHIGIAKAVDESNGNVAIVARFHPVGNLGYRKSFEENVLEPTTRSAIKACYGNRNISMNAEEITTTEPAPTGREISQEEFTEIPEISTIATTLPSVTTPPTTTATTTLPSTTTSPTTTTTTTTGPPTTSRPLRPRPDPMGLALHQTNYDDDDYDTRQQPNALLPL